MKNLKFKDLILISMLILVIIINTVDFIKDIHNGDEWLHILLEIMTVTLSAWGIYMLVCTISARTNQISALNRKVDKTVSDLNMSHGKLKEIGREYSKHIHEQFEVWGLTPSEKEVAMLLLKGLSFIEIADIRSTKEKTVRQQASSIYVKSDVSGRHEFAAWFFEDLLV
jgi:DNA-binding CsgD family transcriptional regulator